MKQGCGPLELLAAQLPCLSVHGSGSGSGVGAEVGVEVGVEVAVGMEVGFGIVLSGVEGVLDALPYPCGQVGVERHPGSSGAALCRRSPVHTKIFVVDSEDRSVLPAWRVAKGKGHPGSGEGAALHLIAFALTRRNAAIRCGGDEGRDEVTVITSDNGACVIVHSRFLSPPAIQW
ncbi:unnamed protein product [Ostreobium quekettii]|uniref:Uncharacterized protein n=1 Tax=Ostreobium quekettii TaxID=121088 RepID=A0A8S1J4F4_9CHLO|nr:unnamed protein product [Ostreobium quekettii]